MTQVFLNRILQVFYLFFLLSAFPLFEFWHCVFSLSQIFLLVFLCFSFCCCFFVLESVFLLPLLCKTDFKVFFMSFVNQLDCYINFNQIIWNTFASQFIWKVVVNCIRFLLPSILEVHRQNEDHYFLHYQKYYRNWIFLQYNCSSARFVFIP